MRKEEIRRTVELALKRGVAYLDMAAMGRAVICGKSAGILKNSRIFCAPIIPARALSAASTRKGTIGPSWTVAFGAIYYMKDLRRDGAIRHLDLSPDAPEMVRRFHCGKKGGSAALPRIAGNGPQTAFSRPLPQIPGSFRRSRRSDRVLPCRHPPRRRIGRRPEA